jgi:hypothetical protein
MPQEHGASNAYLLETAGGKLPQDESKSLGDALVQGANTLKMIMDAVAALRQTSSEQLADLSRIRTGWLTKQSRAGLFGRRRRAQRLFVFARLNVPRLLGKSEAEAGDCLAYVLFRADSVETVISSARKHALLDSKYGAVRHAEFDNPARFFHAFSVKPIGVDAPITLGSPTSLDADMWVSRVNQALRPREERKERKQSAREQRHDKGRDTNKRSGTPRRAGTYDLSAILDLHEQSKSSSTASTLESVLKKCPASGQEASMQCAKDEGDRTIASMASTEAASSLACDQLQQLVGGAVG